MAISDVMLRIVDPILLLSGNKKDNDYELASKMTCLSAFGIKFLYREGQGTKKVSIHKWTNCTLCLTKDEVKM